MTNRAKTAYGTALKRSTLAGICGRMALAATLTLGLSGWTEAATISAASASLADVTLAVASAADGDTVVVPAGTASWTSSLNITKSITLQGSTTVPSGPPDNPATAIDSTIILDDVPRVNGDAYMLQVTLSANAGVFRMTGFTFKPGSVTTVTTGNPSFKISGIGSGTSPAGNSSVPQFRIDHCHFNQLLHLTEIWATGWVYGVIDNNVFDLVKGSLGEVSYSGWDNQPSGFGSWADPTNFGSGQAIYVETNTIRNLIGAIGVNRCSLDGVIGGRGVMRYNYIYNGNVFYHGSDSGSGGIYNRSVRSYELYKNKFVTDVFIGSGQNRGGPLMHWGNTYTGPYGGSENLSVYRLIGGRADSAGTWGAGDGKSAWDWNDKADHTGNGYGGGPNGLFGVGTVLSSVGLTSTSTSSITVSGSPWTTNQWANYGVVNTNTGSTHYLQGTRILSNTANTLSLATGSGWSIDAVFNTADTFAIYKPLVVLDQPGRGQSDLIVGNPAGSTSLSGTAWDWSNGSSASWPHNKLEPCYSWLNTLGGVQVDMTAPPILQANRDYFNQTSLTNGSVGVGIGTTLPATCSPGNDITGVTTNPPGAGFWKTDTNTLYVCTATNTWTAYYTPYTYPHPLVSGLPGPPANLRVVP